MKTRGLQPSRSQRKQLTGHGPNCPMCGRTVSNVIDSRQSGAAIRQRRTCINCEYRFTTYETADEESFVLSYEI